MALSVAGLRIELVGREITGRPVPGRPRRAYGPFLSGLPALALISLLLVPIAITVAAAFRTTDGPGLGNFAVLKDPQALRAIVNSVIWIGVALALVVAGFWVALAGRRVPRLWPALRLVLVFPFAVAVLISGAAFRIIFDPAPARGTVTALVTGVFGESPVWLGPGLFWFVVVSAFAWTWLGYVASLFRAGLDAIPADLARTVEAEGVRGWRRLLAVELPLLRPITGVVTLTLVVAAVRLFDLVLGAVPASMHDDANVLGLHWWRVSGEREGRLAAVALVLFAVAAAVALLGMRGLRRSWAVPDGAHSGASGAAQDVRTTARTRRRWAVVVAPLALLWAMPALVLLATALHDPDAAGLAGWWRAEGIGFDSFTEISNAALWWSLLSTALIALIATLLVVGIGVVTAYLLAWGGLPRWLGRAAVTAFVVLAVAPVQLYAAPLRAAATGAGVAGSPVFLGLVHAAAGLPFAVLLLRAAFASVPPSLVAEALHGQTTYSSAIARVSGACRPALVAVAVLEFVLVWNDFIVGFLISGAGSSPLSLLLWGEAKQFATSAGPVAATAVVASVVPVVLLLTTWSIVVRGLTVGTAP